MIDKEEAERKEEAKRAQAAAGETASVKKTQNAPVVKENTYGRNDLVTIIKGEETKELKYKKAEAYLQAGWSLR